MQSADSTAADNHPTHRQSYQVQLKEQLLSKIENRTACIGVVGLGYVGLPLALEFARAGFKVIGYDVSDGVVKALSAGKSHIQDVPSAEVARLVKAGRFEATTDEARMQEMDAVSIAVPTPLAKTRDPDMGYVIAAADAVGRNCRPGVVVVLESTTYPGTTREMLQPKLEAAGLTVGQDVFLAFSPERGDPGNPKWNKKNTPKIGGGTTGGGNRDRGTRQAAGEHLSFSQHRSGERDGDCLRQTRGQRLGGHRGRSYETF